MSRRVPWDNLPGSWMESHYAPKSQVCVYYMKVITFKYDRNQLRKSKMYIN